MKIATYIIALLNLILSAISIFSCFWTLYNIFTAEADTIFVGLLILIVIFAIMYYLTLLLIGVFLAWKIISDRMNKPEGSLILLGFNVIPMLLIFI